MSLALIAALMLAQGAPNSPAITVTAEHKRPGHEWMRAQSRHFIILSDRRRGDVAELVRRMESFHMMLRMAIGLPAQESEAAPRTKLYFLSNERDLPDPAGNQPMYGIGLYAACSEGVTGFGVDMLYVAAPGKPLDKQPENEGLSYLYQSYARHFWYRHSRARSPLWFVEGFAQYMSSARLVEDDAIIGMAPEALARLATRTGSYQLTYADVLLGTRKDLLATGDRAAVKNEFAARAWVLTHWILSSPANQARARSYFEAVNRGEAAVAAFKRIFGLSPGALDDMLWRYAGTLQAQRLRLKDIPDASAQYSDYDKGEGAGLMLDAALLSCPAVPQAARLAGEAQKLAADHPASRTAAQAALHAQVLFGDAGAAMDALARLAAASPQDVDARYWLGRARLAMAERKGDAALLKQARADLMQAATMDPTHAPAAYAYYRASLLANVLDEDAEGAILAAYQAEPEVDAYTWQAGLVYAMLGRQEDADALFRALASEPDDNVWVIAARARLAKGGNVKGGEVTPADLKAAAALDVPRPARAPRQGRLQWTIANARALNELDVAAAAQSVAEGGDGP